RNRCVGSSCEPEAALPAIPHSYTPAFDGLKLAPWALVLCSKPGDNLNVLSSGKPSVSCSEAATETKSLGHQPFATASTFARFSAAFWTAVPTTFFSSSTLKPESPPFCIAQIEPFLSIVTVNLALITCSSSSDGSTSLVLLTLAKVTELGSLFTGS